MLSHHTVPNTGGRYDPSTDSWTATSTVNTPVGRFYHTAVWTGSEMVVWGGYGGGSGYLNSGGRYNPEHRQLDSHHHHQCARLDDTYHTAVWDSSEMIVWGGYDVGPVEHRREI